MAHATTPATPTLVALPSVKKAAEAVAYTLPAKATAAAPARPSKVRVTRRGKRVTLTWKSFGASAHRVTLRGAWTRTLTKPRLKLRIPATCRGKLQLKITALNVLGIPSRARTVRVPCRR
jgi:hypothetical protein